MRKNVIWVIAGVVLLAIAGVGIWKLVKNKSFRPVSAVLVSPKGNIRLSPAETMNSQKIIPALPGNQINNVSTGPGSIRREMQTINEIQRINEMNKRNAR
jgi:hypothetical protein